MSELSPDSASPQEEVKSGRKNKHNFGWGDEVVYRRLMESTTLFAGVKAIEMLISLGRSKAMAVFLGPEGSGTFWLFFSTMMLIQSFTTLSMTTSGVREIAEAWGKGDLIRTGQLYTAMQRILRVFAIAGGVALFIFAETASMYTFENTSHVLGFRIMAGYFIFYGIYIGQEALLQGTKRPIDAALCTLFTNVISVLVMVLLLSRFGEEGIIPSIMVYPIIASVITQVAVRHVPILKERSLSWKETFGKARAMLYLGLALTISGVAFNWASWWIRTYVKSYSDSQVPLSGDGMVGLYSAAYSITMSATMFIAGALSLEFFPRLSSLRKQSEKFSLLVNKQTEVVMMITGPILLGALVYSDKIFVALNSESFFFGTDAFRFFLVAAFVQLTMWPLGLVRYAHKWVKLTFSLEVLSCLMNAGLAYILYPVMGVTGLGVAYLLLRGYEYIQAQLLGRYIMGYRISKHTMLFSLVSISSFIAVLIAIGLGNNSIGISVWCFYSLYVVLVFFRELKDTPLSNESSRVK